MISLKARRANDTLFSRAFHTTSWYDFRANDIRPIWGRLFNDTVYMEFRVCFTIAKYENDMFSLFETSNVFIDAFSIQKSILISQDLLN